MALLERCQLLQEKRKRLVALNGDSQETTALKSHTNQLSSAFQDFTGAVDLRGAYLSEQIPLQPVDAERVKLLMDVLGRIRERFKKDRTRSALVAEKDWPALMEGVKGLTTAVKEGCRQGWTTYTIAFFAQTAIVESMVVKTDANLALLQEYKKLLRELQSLAAVWEDVSSVQAFKSKGKRLQKLAEGLNDFHAPDVVKAFLDAVSANGGAPLDLLTTEVVMWLKEQEMYTKYKIIRGF